MRCSFCNKAQDQVGKLISAPSADPQAFICDECVAVCNSILEDDAHQRAPDAKDPLTRLRNRSSILRYLQMELPHGPVEGRCIGVVLAALDQFEELNQKFGNDAGDAALCEFSERMLSTIWPYDSMGRYSADEFLIVLPGCDQRCTARHSERMRAACADQPVVFNARRHPATASFGATTWLPGVPGEAENLVRVAENALSMARKQGRNRVVVLPSC
jgi:diguanylate cyclase (GGDEF)-like protein